MEEEKIDCVYKYKNKIVGAKVVSSKNENLITEGQKTMRERKEWR